MRGGNPADHFLGPFDADVLQKMLVEIVQVTAGNGPVTMHPIRKIMPHPLCQIGPGVVRNGPGIIEARGKET